MHREDRIFYEQFNHATQDDFQATKFKYHDMNMVNFIYLNRYLQNGSKVLQPYDEEAKKYMTIRYGQKIANYSESDPADWFKYSYDEAVPCTKEHFTVKKDQGNDDPEKASETILLDTFANYEGYPLICMPRNKDYTLQGTIDAFMTQSVVIEILKCDNTTNGDSCPWKEEVDDYISRIVPEIWFNLEQIDFTTYVTADQGRPTFRIDQFQLGELINPHKLRENWIYVRKNDIEVESALVQFGVPDREDTFFDIWRAQFNDGYAPTTDPQLVVQSYIGFGPSGAVHKRKNYSLMEIIGDLGGVFELLVLCVGFFIRPISRHSFIMKVLRKTFMIEQHIQRKSIGSSASSLADVKAAR